MIFYKLMELKYLSIALLGAGVSFVLQYYLLSTLPGTNGLACQIGANLTLINIMYAIVSSMMFGMFLAGLAIMLKNKIYSKLPRDASFFSLAVIFSVFTSFCTLCTLPALSFFGFSLSLVFFTTYSLYFRILSLLLLYLGLFIVNLNIEKSCSRCYN